MLQTCGGRGLACASDAQTTLSSLPQPEDLGAGIEVLALVLFFPFCPRF